MGATHGGCRVGATHGGWYRASLDERRKHRESKEIRQCSFSLLLPAPRFGNTESRDTVALELWGVDFQDDKNPFFLPLNPLTSEPHALALHPTRLC